jgi:hypothetical protein
MADNNANIYPYPFMFDPSQFSNKYSPFAGRSMSPYMGQYSGTPTDAHGNPIQSFQDAQAQHNAWAAAHPAPAMAPPMTLNSNAGLEPLGSQARAMQNAGYGDWAMLDPMMAHTSIPGQTGGAGSVAATTGWNPANPSSISAGNQVTNADKGSFGGWTPTGQMLPGQQAQGQQQAAPPSNPIDMNAAYLAALSNPGKVTTPGATVPQANLPSNQSGVLQNFLANWQQGGGNTKGAGNYDNAGFYRALQGSV